MSRTNPPDAILREVYQRTGDRPFARIEDVISNEELAALSDGYKRVAGLDRLSLQRDGTPVHCAGSVTRSAASAGALRRTRHDHREDRG